MRKIKVGDNVMVVTGKDAGKSGKVTKIYEVANTQGKLRTRVIVEGVNKVKRSRKPNPQLGIAGGVEEFEKGVDISNVMYLEGGKPTRVGFKVVEKTGKKTRISKKSGKVID